MKKSYFEIHPWELVTHEFNDANNLVTESLTSIGNGYMGMRGNFEEGYSGTSLKGTYIAGVWFPDKTRVGWWKNGYPNYFGKVINAIDFISLKITISGTEIDLAKTPFEDYYQKLDMRNGVLTRSYIVNLSGKKTRITFKRFLSITTKELSVQQVEFEQLVGAAEIQVESRLDGNVKNQDSNYDETFWEPVTQKATATELFLSMRTKENPFNTERFTVSALADLNVSKETQPAVAVQNELLVNDKRSFVISENERVSLLKRVAIITSRDIADAEHETTAEHILARTSKDYAELEAEQTAAWAERWATSDIEIAGDDAAQQSIRFNLFELFSTYYGEDSRLNIGPKGFTGEKYGGATYWDTEAYAVPFYLGVAAPSVTKSLLYYRHNQLAQAKHNAAEQGLAGALYPMVTFNGIESHNEWEITFEEIHRNGAMAYAIYNYTNYTGDDSYLANEGLEVLVEISRFWADRVHYSKRNDKYMIHGVTGPNEYENNVNNNWYTNYLARWVLKYTKSAYEAYGAKSKADVPTAELLKWQDIIDKMYLPNDEELGIFVQHDTFLDKDIRPVSALAAEDLPLNQKWSWDRILRSPFIKQADVLQGIYFFGNEFSLDEKKKNFDFYEPLTVHESSLSPSIHAILAAEIGEYDKATEMYNRTARLDLDNYNNDTDDGLHITSMTGTWLAIVQGFAGMRTWDNTLSFAPFLPKNWNNYSFHINYRGRVLRVSVASSVKIELISGETLQIKLYDKNIELSNEITVAVK